MKTTRCTPCGAEFTDEEIENATACPTCGSDGVPMSISKDRQITINEHELRILGIWASNYVAEFSPESSRQMQKALNGIFHRIKKQIPGISLSLADEFQGVADHFEGTVKVLGPQGEEEYKPRLKN